MTDAHHGPIPDAYWADDGVLAGPHPTARAADRDEARAAVRALLDAGVRTVIDLRTPMEPPSIRALLDKLGGDDAVFIAVPILDGAAPTRAQMVAILDAIDAARARGRGVYFHCQGGRGRTGTVAACFWVRHGRFEAEEALAELARRRAGLLHGAHPSPETGPQLRLVRSWRRGA
ncbi:MAG: dual specificity protein phosphatase family protein [Sandaracinaceae bacterium]|nr:dual specificity protein phosphatase family protein [Sandaracinaceae bacterium]